MQYKYINLALMSLPRYDIFFKPLRLRGLSNPVLICSEKWKKFYQSFPRPSADGLDQIATWNGGMLRPEELTTALQAKMSKQQAVFADLLRNTAWGNRTLLIGSLNNPSFDQVLATSQA